MKNKNVVTLAGQQFRSFKIVTDKRRDMHNIKEAGEQIAFPLFV